MIRSTFSALLLTLAAAPGTAQQAFGLALGPTASPRF